MAAATVTSTVEPASRARERGRAVTTKKGYRVRVLGYSLTRPGGPVRHSDPEFPNVPLSDSIAVSMRWVGIVALVVTGVLLSAAAALADAGPKVWLQPGEAAGAASAGEVRLGCAPIMVWAQGDASGEGVWAVTPLAAAGDSGAHILIGRWTYAGGAAAAVADVGELAPGKYQVRLFGALATERIVTVDCARGPA